jgi:predicted small integral membrane protein
MSEMREYQAIIKVWNQKSRYEIEVLPSSFEIPESLIFIDGTCLGIPKKVLVKAFLQARGILMTGFSTSSLLDQVGFPEEQIQGSNLIRVDVMLHVSFYFLILSI